MKWFRSNIRLGSRLALFALAIQCLLSFGHFHGSFSQAGPVSVDAKQSGLREAVSLSPAYLSASDKTRSDHEPAGQSTDDCVICAVMALTHAMVVATPPHLLAPQAAAFRYLSSETGFVDLRSARVAFQPRAPPNA